MLTVRFLLADDPDSEQRSAVAGSVIAAIQSGAER